MQVILKQIMEVSSLERFSFLVSNNPFIVIHDVNMSLMLTTIPR